MIMRHSYTLAVVIIILAGGVIGVSAELSTEYSVDITDSVDIPAQTVETEWGEATITEVGKEEAQNYLELSTDAPENESYAIRIVDSEQRNLKSEFVSGGDVENRELFLDYTPGTYVVALTQDGGDTAVEVEPFVVKGYTLDQSVSDVTKGDTITVTIELTKINDRASDPQAVNVTLYDSGVTRVAEATKTDANSYRANFSTDELSTGSYDIYAGVEGENNVYNFPELIGISDPISVTVESTETSTPVSPPPSNPAPTPTPTPTPTQPLPPASVAFENQTVPNGSQTVTVSSAQLGNQSVPAEEFVVVVHKTTSGGEVGPKVGESDVLSTGTHESIRVDLATTLGGADSIARLRSPQSLIATLYRANTTDDGIIHESQIIRDGDTVTSRAHMTVTDTETVTVDDQEIPVEFTSETDSGSRTVTADDAVNAINTFIAGEISADIAVSVINVFIFS